MNAECENNQSPDALILRRAAGQDAGPQGVAGVLPLSGGVGRIRLLVCLARRHERLFEESVMMWKKWVDERESGLDRYVRVMRRCYGLRCQMADLLGLPRPQAEGGAQ